MNNAAMTNDNVNVLIFIKIKINYIYILNNIIIISFGN